MWSSPWRFFSPEVSAGVDDDSAAFGVEDRDTDQGLIDSTAAEIYDFSGLLGDGLSIFTARPSGRPFTPCCLIQVDTEAGTDSEPETTVLSFSAWRAILLMYLANFTVGWVPTADILR